MFRQFIVEPTQPTTRIIVNEIHMSFKFTRKISRRSISHKKKFSPQSQTPHLVTLNPTKLEIFFGTDP
jgi:hypothetical protein